MSYATAKPRLLLILYHSFYLFGSFGHLLAYLHTHVSYSLPPYLPPTPSLALLPWHSLVFGQPIASLISAVFALCRPGKAETVRRATAGSRRPRMWPLSSALIAPRRSLSLYYSLLSATCTLILRARSQDNSISHNQLTFQRKDNRETVARGLSVQPATCNLRPSSLAGVPTPNTHPSANSLYGCYCISTGPFPARGGEEGESFHVGRSRKTAHTLSFSLS